MKTNSWVAYCLLASMMYLGKSQAAPTDLEARRIAFLWKSDDLANAKIKITEFLEKYPDAPQSHAFRLMLADLHLQRGLCDQALSLFQSSATTSELLLEKEAYCLLAQKEFQTLIERTRSHPSLQRYLAEGLYGAFLAESVPSLKEEWAKQGIEALQQRDDLPAHEMILAFSLYLKDQKMATEQAFAIAEQTPSAHSHWLYLAALLQSSYDAPEALRTLDRVIAENVSLKGKAELNKLKLLFQTAQWEEIAALEDSLETETRELPLTSFTLGVAFQQMGHDEKTIYYLLNISGESPLSEATAVALAQSSFHLEDPSYAELLLSSFPSPACPSEVENALMLRLNALGPAHPVFPHLCTRALSQWKNLKEGGNLHLHLYNHYALSDLKAASYHLLKASESHATVKKENLEWLKTYLAEQSPAAFIMHSLSEAQNEPTEGSTDKPL